MVVRGVVWRVQSREGENGNAAEWRELWVSRAVCILVIKISKPKVFHTQMLQRTPGQNMRNHGWPRKPSLCRQFPSVLHRSLIPQNALKNIFSSQINEENNIFKYYSLWGVLQKNGLCIIENFLNLSKCAALFFVEPLFISTEHSWVVLL